MIDIAVISISTLAIVAIICLVYLLKAVDGLNIEVTVRHETANQNPSQQEAIETAKELNRRSDDSEEEQSGNSSRFDELDPDTTLEELTRDN